MYMHNITGWLSPTPLKNDGVRQLGSVKFPTEWKFIKAMFQTTNQDINKSWFKHVTKKLPGRAPRIGCRTPS